MADRQITPWTMTEGTKWSRPLADDVRTYFNNRGNPIKSMYNSGMNLLGGAVNHLWRGDESDPTNKPMDTNRPTNTLNALRAVATNTPLVNMGNSVGTPAEQAEFMKQYNRTVPQKSKPVGPPGGLLTEAQLQTKYSPVESGMLLGEGKAAENKKAGLFGETVDALFNNPVLSRLMEASLYTKPSFQSGFSADVAGAAQGEVTLRGVEADEAERISKEKLARAKNAKDPRDLMAKEPIIKMYRRIQGSRIALEKTTAMQTLLRDSAWTTGGLGKASDFFTGFAAIVGIPLRASKKEEMMTELNIIIEQLVKSGAFGKDASATDYKTMFNSIGTPDWTTNRDILSKKFSAFQDQTSRNIKIDEGYLNTLGISIPGIEANASKRPRFGRKRNPS
jgi:hypothetical protein